MLVCDIGSVNFLYEVDEFEGVTEKVNNEGGSSPYKYFS